MTEQKKINHTTDKIIRDSKNNGDCYSTLTIDYALYEDYLENSDLSEREKQEFLDALWSIIVNFVDLGFGVHPLQQACEQNDQELASITAEMIRSETPKSNL